MYIHIFFSIILGLCIIIPCFYFLYDLLKFTDEKINKDTHYYYFTFDGNNDHNCTYVKSYHKMSLEEIEKVKDKLIKDFNLKDDELIDVMYLGKFDINRNQFGE